MKYRITKNFHDKKLSRISRILEYHESFFREISGNVHVSVDAMPFRETFLHEMLLHCVSWKFFVAKVFSYTVCCRNTLCDRDKLRPQFSMYLYIVCGVMMKLNALYEPPVTMHTDVVDD